MSGLLFVSQAMLDSWAEQGKIDFVGNVMTLLAGEGKGRSYALEPAVRFMKVLGGENDSHGLLHKVKTVTQLKDLGADPAGDSCILGDVAYEVQPGFLAEASALQAAAAAQPGSAPLGTQAADRATPPRQEQERSRSFSGAPLPKDLEEKRKEAEALARFVLEDLS